MICIREISKSQLEIRPAANRVDGVPEITDGVRLSKVFQKVSMIL